MAVIAGASIFLSVGSSPVIRRELRTYFGQSNWIPKLSRRFDAHVPEAKAVIRALRSTESNVSFSENGSFHKETEADILQRSIEANKEGDDGGTDEVGSASLKDFFEQSKQFIKSDGGPPRWFSPLECGNRLENSPLLLYLPGIDGTGLGIMPHHHRLGRIFDIWCLHIPVMDRTSFTDLVKLVERTIRLENECSPKKPIYIVGESLGGCIALAVAARNPDVDLVLILANPATSFGKSHLPLAITLLEAMPSKLSAGLPYVWSLAAGNSLRISLESVARGVPPHQLGQLSEGLLTILSHFSALSEILPQETLLWKLKMLKSSSAYANSRLHAVKAQTLILSSGKDQLLPSEQECERLQHILQKSELRSFTDNGHFLFLESGIDLVTIIKGASYYRRANRVDYVSDYLPPTRDEFNRIFEPYRFFNLITSPAVLSTLEDGQIVRGLAGFPAEGPVLFVGYHMLLGLELFPLISKIYTETNIVVRGIAHPLTFFRHRKGKLPEIATYDSFRLMGAVPASGTNLFKLLSSKSHVLLYPGGMREALHRKGEEYKLFWPQRSEFIRMAARFGAKIIPFGAVGEDDFGEVVVDYNDLMKNPFFRAEIEDLTSEVVKLRTDASGEVTEQDIHLPGILPKLPGRFYYYFGKPIETEGRKQELRDRQKCHELYLQVKNEVENCIAYLKTKRESDPYRGLLPRLVYQASHGFTAEVPTFEI